MFTFFFFFGKRISQLLFLCKSCLLRRLITWYQSIQVFCWAHVFCCVKLQFSIILVGMVMLCSKASWNSCSCWRICFICPVWNVWQCLWAWCRKCHSYNSAAVFCWNNSHMLRWTSSERIWSRFWHFFVHCN